MAVSRGGWLNRKGSMKKGKLLTGILTGVLAFSFMAALVPVASAKITQIEIDEPGGGEVYADGVYYIWWHQAAESTSDSVDIYFSPDGGTTYQLVKDNFTAGVTDYTVTVGCTWDTGAVSIPGDYSNQCVIRLQDSSTGYPRDDSNQFTIDRIYPSIDTAYFTGDNELVVIFSETVDLIHPESFAVPLACASGLSGSVQYSISDTTFSVSKLTATCQCNGTTLSVSSQAVFDLAGNPLSPTTASVLGDKTPPTVTVVVSPEPASAVTVDFTLNFSEIMATDDIPVLYFTRDCNQTETIQLINVAWSTDGTTLTGQARRVHMRDFAEQGLNTLYISTLTPVYDRCGNPEEGLSGPVRKFIIDKTAPTIAKVDGPDNGECASTQTPVFTVDVADTLPPCTDSYTGVIALEYQAPPATSTWQTVPIIPPSLSTSVTFTTIALSPDTAYTVSVRSVDAASNRSSIVSYTFNVDTTPPTITSAEFITDTEMLVNFSEPVNVVHPQSFALPITCASGIVGWTDTTSVDEITFTLSGLTTACQCAGSILSLSAGAVVDLCGNPIEQITAAVAPDRTAPEFVDAEFLSCASMDATFNEALISVDAASFWSAYCSFDSASIDPLNNRLVHFGISNLAPDYQENGIDDLWIMAGAVEDNCSNPIASVSGLSVAGDTTVPEVVAVSASPDFLSAATVDITVTFNECMATSVAPTVTFGVATPYTAYAVPTGTWESATQWTGSVLVSCDSAGWNGVRVADAQDAAGNTVTATEVSAVFYIDCFGPSITVDSPACGSYISVATPRVTVTVTDECSIDTVQYRIVPSASWYTVTPHPVPSPTISVSFDLAEALSEGVNCIELRARDVLGNWTDPYKECCWTVDTTPPEFVDAEFISCDEMLVYFSEDLMEVNCASFTSTSCSFTDADIVVGASSTVIVAVSSATLSVTDQTNGISGANGLDILAGAVKDLAGNPIQTITGQTVRGDETQPWVTDIVASPCCVDAETIAVTVYFNECMATPVTVSVGLETPYDTYPVSGSWTDVRTWEGTISAASVAALPDGWYGVGVAGAKDRAGNTITPDPTTDGNMFLVDHTAPTVQVNVTPKPVFAGEEVHVSLHFSEWVHGDPTVYFSGQGITKYVNGDWVNRYEYLCDEPVYEEWAGISTAPLTPGTYYVYIYGVYDCPEHHLSYPSSYSFEVMAPDRVPPEIKDLAPTGIISDATPVISASFEDAGSGISTGTAVMSVDGVNVTASAAVTTAGISYTPASALSEGVHSVTVDVKDNAGNAANQASWQFVVDTQGAESIYIISPLEGSYVKGDMEVEAVVSDVWSGAEKISFFATDATTAVGGVSLGEATAQPWAITYDTTAISDGTWYLYAVAQDGLGHSATSSTVGVTVDNTAPEIDILGEWPVCAKAGESSFVGFIYTEDNPASVVLEVLSGSTVLARVERTTQLAGGSDVTDGILGILPSDLEEGVYDLRVTMTDAAGSSASDVVVGAIQIDNTPPVFDFASFWPRPDMVVGEAELSAGLQIRAVYSDDGCGVDTDAVKIVVDSNDVTGEASITSTEAVYETTYLPDGVRSVEVTVADEAGNQVQTTWFFTVDTIAPTVGINQPNEGDFVSGVVTIEAGAGAEDITEVHFLVDDWEVCLDTDGSDGWTCAWDTTEESEGVHVLKAQVYDEAFNFGESQPVQVTVDNTAPVAQIIDPVSGNVAYVNPGDNLKVTYTYTEMYPYAVDVEVKNADGKVAGSTHVENLTGATEPVTVETTVPIYDEPDVPVGMYNLVVTITDKAGNSVSYTEENAVCIFLSKVEKVVGKKGGTVELGDGTKVVIPEGALDSDTPITVEALEPQDIPEFDIDGVTATDVARFFGPEGLVFAKLVTVTIPYTERDIAGLDESKLALYVWDGLGWYRVGDETVDANANTITAKVNHFSIYRLVEDTTEAAGFKVYLTRNPFLSGQGTMFVYSLPKAGKVTLKIYDATGDLVKTLLDGVSQSAGWHNVKWDGDNDFFSFVGSGLYIYRFEVKYTGGGSDKEIKPVGVIK